MIEATVIDESRCIVIGFHIHNNTHSGDKHDVMPEENGRNVEGPDDSKRDLA